MNKEKLKEIIIETYFLDYLDFNLEYVMEMGSVLPKDSGYPYKIFFSNKPDEKHVFCRIKIYKDNGHEASVAFDRRGNIIERLTFGFGKEFKNKVKKIYECFIYENVDILYKIWDTSKHDTANKYHESKVNDNPKAYFTFPKKCNKENRLIEDLEYLFAY